jgi:ssDNA-binding replication factor A large subunit
MFLKITIDDGTETIRVSLFSGSGAEDLLGMSAKEANDLIIKSGNINEPILRMSNQILGKYVRILGTLNRYRDSVEVTAKGLSFIEPEDEIERLTDSLQKEVAR